jgi:cell division protein FtsI/penicillin-binding protein 2
LWLEAFLAAAFCRISSRLGLVRLLDIIIIIIIIVYVVYKVVVASTSEKKKEIPRGRQKTVDFDVSRGSIVDDR